MRRAARGLATIPVLVSLVAGAAGYRAVPRATDPFRHLGTWVDVYDFTPERSVTGIPRLGTDAVDRMAAAGIRTLYLQASTPQRPAAAPLESPGLLAEFVRRAHRRGMRVVGWYAPAFVNPGADLARLLAIRDFRVAGQGFDGIGVDIETTTGVRDTATRNQVLVDLSRRLRGATALPLAAIVLPPVQLEVVNPAYWPAFPWRSIAASYDAWMPMSYWTERAATSPYRDPWRYTDENIRRLRRDLGRPSAEVHVIGGIGGQTTARGYRGFVAAARAHGAAGLSIYDFVTTGPAVWRLLAGTT